MQTTQAIRKLAKAIKSDARKALKAGNEWAKFWFADYCVVDNFGTRQLCWTRKGAMAWLPYCANNARICHMGQNNRTIVQRLQNA